MSKDNSENNGNTSYNELQLKRREKSCGAVLFSPDGCVLLVKNRRGNIGFPKGHQEDGETEEQTAMREILEETELEPRLMNGFRQSYLYFPDPWVEKTAVYFVGMIEEGACPKAPPEEIGGIWLLPVNEAREALSYPADKCVLDLAINWKKENQV